MGLPLGATKQACVRDGKDPTTMDLDPDKSLASQRGRTDATPPEDTGPSLRDDPEYAKVSLNFDSFVNKEILNLMNVLLVLENA